jgi:hypothetical protein
MIINKNHIIYFIATLVQNLLFNFYHANSVYLGFKGKKSCIQIHSFSFKNSKKRVLNSVISKESQSKMSQL